MPGLQPAFEVALKQLCREMDAAGIRYRINSLVRDQKEQQILYDRRQRTLAGTLRPGERPQRFPVARPGTSQHELGLAADISIPGLQSEVGQDWRDSGYGWFAEDDVHFQLKPFK